jgi:hypothetical protein
MNSRKMRRRPTTGRAGLNGGAPRSLTVSQSRIFPACGAGIPERMLALDAHGPRGLERAPASRDGKWEIEKMCSSAT